MAATQHQLPDALSTEHLHANLKGRSVRGGAVTLTSQGTQFVVQSVATLTLARLLTPADFGLVAMVTAITSLASAFADFGLSEATVQGTDINNDQVSTLFWVNVGIGCTLALLTASLAPLLAWFYRLPQLKSITLVLSFSFLVGGLRVQHDALLKRQMRYMSIAIRDIISIALSVPLAIVMAWKGFGYWSLVALPLSANFIQTVLSWLMVRWIPGLPKRNAKVRSMIAFGGNVAASYFVINTQRNADNVLIGWWWGAGPLGLYSRAYNLLMLPVRQLSSPASSVAIPAFSRIQEEPERFARYYLRAINLIMWISGAIFGSLFVAATPVIVLALGNKWRAAAPVFQILAISAIGQLLLESTIWLFVSRGQSSRLLRLLMITSPILVASFVIGLPFGISGVALSGSAALLLLLPLILRFAFRGTSLTLKRLGEAILYPITMSLAAVGISETALHLFSFRNVLAQLAITGLSFAGTYALAALVPPVRKEILSFRSLLVELRFSSGETI